MCARQPKLQAHANLTPSPHLPYEPYIYLILSRRPPKASRLHIINCTMNSVTIREELLIEIIMVFMIVWMIHRVL